MLERRVATRYGACLLTLAHPHGLNPWLPKVSCTLARTSSRTRRLIKGVYLSLCLLLDFLYENRPIQRFWFLETVARMPYFSYISMLHLYESLGWWRAGAELRKIHFAEEWNELHHLQVWVGSGDRQAGMGLGLGTQWWACHTQGSLRS